MSDVVVRRTLRCSPQEAYDEWLDPEAMLDWMCPRPARCRAVELDPRVGGKLRIDIEEDGVVFFVAGTYVALDRPRMLRFTWWCSTWTDPDLATTVTVTFDPDENGDTLMIIRHDMLPPDLVERHEPGWGRIAAQFADVVEINP